MFQDAASIHLVKFLQDFPPARPEETEAAASSTAGPSRKKQKKQRDT